MYIGGGGNLFQGRTIIIFQHKPEIYGPGGPYISGDHNIIFRDRLTVPVRADTYTGVCRRLDLFPSLAMAQWRREQNPVRRFGVISNNPQSHHHRSRNSCYSMFADKLPSFANNELRVRVYRRYGRDATVRVLFVNSVAPPPLRVRARCQESASCPLRQRG